MFDSLEAGSLEHRAAGFGTADILKGAEAAQRARVAAENELLVWAIAWADAYPAESIHGDQLRLSGGQRGVRPGGDGTPEVNDLAMIEFSTKIGKSTGAGLAFIGDALDLRDRLPELWGKVMRCEVIGWQGCKIARLTRDLTYDQARFVDDQVARFAGVVPWTKLENKTLAAILAVDPARYEELMARRKKNRGVWMSQTGDDGLRGVHVRLEAIKAARFYACVEELAGYLPTDSGTADERRAEAFSLLGDDLRAAELRARHRQPDLFDGDLAAAVADIEAETGGPVEESEVHPSLRDQPPGPDTESAIFQAALERMLQELDPAKLLPTVVLVVHLAGESLESGSGVCRVPGIGPTTMGLVKDWLGHHRVTVRPVIDLNDLPAPVDCYEIPDRHKQHLFLQWPGSRFPWSTSIDGLEVDHVHPYRDLADGGPPAQTDIASLTPLAKREHRAVTHGGWQRRKPDLGTMIFRSPHGHIFLTNHTGTHDLGDGAFAQAVWNAAKPHGN